MYLPYGFWDFLKNHQRFLFNIIINEGVSQMSQLVTGELKEPCLHEGKEGLSEFMNK